MGRFPRTALNGFPSYRDNGARLRQLGYIHTPRSLHRAIFCHAIVRCNGRFTPAASEGRWVLLEPRTDRERFRPLEERTRHTIGLITIRQRSGRVRAGSALRELRWIGHVYCDASLGVIIPPRPLQ